MCCFEIGVLKYAAYHGHLSSNQEWLVSAAMPFRVTGMEETYAHALLHVIRGGMQPKKAVAALVDKLEREGRSALFPRISRAFARIAERESRKTRLTLTVAREEDESASRRDAKKILDEMNVDSKDAEISLDDSLIGGWRLEGRENLVDNSFKKHLLSIYNRATQ